MTADDLDAFFAGEPDTIEEIVYIDNEADITIPENIDETVDEQTIETEEEQLAVEQNDIEVAETPSPLKEEDIAPAEPENIIWNEQAGLENAPTENIEATSETQETLPPLVEDFETTENTPEVLEIPVEEPLEITTVDLESFVVEQVQEPEQKLQTEIDQVKAIAEDVSPFRAAPSNTITVWEAKRKANLHDVVQSWCAEENIKLIWDAPKDYVLNKDILINGTFKNALGILFSRGLSTAPQYLLNEDNGYELRIKG